jgi:DNA primase|tara:strand:+ start:28 stop:948 length:921 start_codon:yes stop_codon:yes gene_type:complete
MYKYELNTLLEKVLGISYQMKNGESAYHCPFCNHHKKKLQVNFETQKWHCWVCNQGGHKIGILLRKINAPKQIISEVLKILGDYKGVKYEKDEKTEYNVSLPQCYKPLWKKSEDPLYKNAIHYLRQRGIGGIDILRYSMGYCTSNGYSNRIIIPSYDKDGKLNYFIARDMFPNSKFKYKNPPMSKDMIGFEMYINWNEPIVLCEGVFDAIAIRNNAIPLLGKFLSKTLLKKLAEKQPKEVYVALDNDAKKDAIKLVKFLMDSGIKTYLLEMNDKDPSELGFKKFWKIVEKAKPFKFSDVVKGRLYV